LRERYICQCVRKLLTDGKAELMQYRRGAVQFPFDSNALDEKQWERRLKLGPGSKRMEKINKKIKEKIKGKRKK